MRARIGDAGEIPRRGRTDHEQLANRRRPQVETAASGRARLREGAHSKQLRSGGSTLWENVRKAWHVRYPTAILSLRYKFLYYPIPKAASSSVKRLIANLEGVPHAGIPQHDIDFDCVWGANAGRFRDCISFTVVRNPWDRFLSCYFDKIRGGSEDPVCSKRPSIHEGFLRYNRLLGRELFHSEMSFPDFAKVISWIPDYLADEHFRSQYRMFSAPNGTSLVSRIIRFESLHEGICALMRDVGAAETSLEFSNRTRHANYHEFYDSVTRELVGRRYRRDIEQLGYQF